MGESLEQKNVRLWSTLKQFSDVRVNYCETEKQIIFPVNATARDEHEKKIADTIRRIVCQSYIEAEIPARWFLFQLELQDLQKTTESMVVSKSECLKIGLAQKSFTSRLHLLVGDILHWPQCKMFSSQTSHSRMHWRCRNEIPV